jgi:beta-glucosidase
MLADLGFNAYRFSLTWARIEPTKGEFSRAELKHYRRVLEACHRHRIIPLVTFLHVTAPQWFAYEGGWQSPESIERFALYCEQSAQYLGDLIGWAATFNEPNLLKLLSWIRLPSGQRLTDVMTESQAQVRQQLKAEKFSTFLGGSPDTMQQNMLRAHEKGKAAIKSAYPKLPVGLTLAMEDDQPAGEGSRFEKKRKEVYGPWLELARQDDFLGVQTYTRQRIGNADANLPPPKDAELTQSGYEFYPEALEHTIRYASQQTGVPVIVTENGIATDNDARRLEYIQRAVQGVKRCLADKIDVRGYLYWSLLDNFEWVSGYSQQFGLVAVDRTTQRRTIKPSATYLGKFARGS